MAPTIIVTKSERNHRFILVMARMVEIDGNFRVLGALDSSEAFFTAVEAISEPDL